jgi:hypothetical protein
MNMILISIRHRPFYLTSYRIFGTRCSAHDRENRGQPPITSRYRYASLKTVVYRLLFFQQKSQAGDENVGMELLMFLEICVSEHISQIDKLRKFDLPTTYVLIVALYQVSSSSLSIGIYLLAAFTNDIDVSC